jgi:hypothetical protein
LTAVGFFVWGVEVVGVEAAGVDEEELLVVVVVVLGCGAGELIRISFENWKSDVNG